MLNWIPKSGTKASFWLDSILSIAANVATVFNFLLDGGYWDGVICGVASMSAFTLLLDDIFVFCKNRKVVK